MVSLFIIGLLFFGSVLGTCFVIQYMSEKISEMNGRRWERKLLKGVAQIERNEEVAEAEKDLEEEMSSWNA